MRHRLFASLDMAEECGDGNMISNARRAAAQNLELSGKLPRRPEQGLDHDHQRSAQPAYVEMRVELVEALAPYPEARYAVAQVLHAARGQGGRP